MTWHDIVKVSSNPIVNSRLGTPANWSGNADSSSISIRWRMAGKSILEKKQSINSQPVLSKPWLQSWIRFWHCDSTRQKLLQLSGGFGSQLFSHGWVSSLLIVFWDHLATLCRTPWNFSQGLLQGQPLVEQPLGRDGPQLLWTIGANQSHPISLMAKWNNRSSGST